MPKPARAARAGQKTSKRRPRAWLALAGAAAVAVIAVAATALAAGTSLTLASAQNSTLAHAVVVNPQGRTLYRLSPETSRHLLCKSRECLTNWPPLTVRSASTKLKAGSGVKGKLALLRRGAHSFQVTLNGLPLYRYAGDSAKGQANGEGIESFGGTWHAVRAASSATGGMAPAGTTPTSTSSEPTPYKY